MSYIALLSPSGNVVRTLRATPLTVKSTVTLTSVEPNTSHLILVIDQSGSMWHDMPAMKSTLLKLLALEEYKNDSLSVSLLSYSSSGEVYTHIRRAPVTDILGPSGIGRQAIENLRATNLTCISGGLKAGLDLIRGDESTTIVLHSDGYANDPSPYSESTAIGRVLDDLSKHPNVMVSTVCYGAADFALLDMIASRGGGVCVQAKSAGQVFDALHNVTKPATDKAAPPLVLHASQSEACLVAVSKSARKVMVGRDGSIMIKGLKPSDDLEVFEVGDFQRASDQWLETTDTLPALLYARAMVAAGKLNTAKQVILGLGAETLYPHLRALTSPQVAAFAQALEAAIFGDIEITFTEARGLPNGVTVFDVLEVLRQHEGQYLVNVPMLTEGRQRRSIARKHGAWVDGKIVPPAYITKAKDSSPWARVSSIEMSRTAATINMNVTRDVDLVDAQGSIVREVAGVPLALKDYRNITIVGEGNPLVESLYLKVTDKRLTRRLADLGYQPVEGVTTIPVGKMSVVNPGEVGHELVADTTLFDRLTLCAITRKMLDAALEGQSVKYTAEQVAELEAHCLSKSCNYNPPTVNPYEDRAVAISRGEIDSYTTYRIELGSLKLFSLSDLPSANDFLARRFKSFEVNGGKPIEKPTMQMVVSGVAAVEVKNSKEIKRLKMTIADELMLPLFLAFLGLTEEDGYHGGRRRWLDTLSAAGVDSEDADHFIGGAIFDHTSDRRTELLTSIRDAIALYEDAMIAQSMAPTVLFAGATGFLPEPIADVTTALTADELEAAHVGLKVPTKKRESTFYTFEDGRVLSVRPETIWYSTGQG